MLLKIDHQDEELPVFQRQHPVLHGGLSGRGPRSLTQHAHGRMGLLLPLGPGIQFHVDSLDHLDLHLAALLYPLCLLEAKSLVRREIPKQVRHRSGKH